MQPEKFMTTYASLIAALTSAVTAALRAGLDKQTIVEALQTLAHGLEESED